MANIFGIEYDSPAEIKAVQEQKFQQAAQQAAQQNNVAALQRISQQRAISTLFGSPELNQAQRTEKALNEIQKTVTKNPDENEFDFQVRQAEAIRGKLAGVNPSVALKANEQILALRQAQLQQKRLQGQVDSEDLKLSEAQNTALLAKQGWVFERQADGELRPVRKLSEGQPTEDDLGRFEEMRQENPRLVLGSGLDVLKMENLLSGSRSGGKLINNSAVEGHLDAIEAAAGFARDTKFFARDLSKDVAALGLGRGAISDVSALQATVDRFQGAFLETFADDDERAAAEVEAETVFDRVAARSNLTNATALAQSQVKAMAYKLAKALDPGGRLSDQDVEMAIEMIIGSGNPEVIEKLLRQRLETTYQGIQASIDLAERGLIYDESGKRAVARLNQAMADAEEAIGMFNMGIQEAKKAGNLGVRDPAAPATPPAGGMTREQKIAAARAKAQQQGR